ncbi:uncharacterized protein LOC120632992 [Pararge aegeria]|uniref:uncharacterized protein LOC120632992 n=1 Tax=Pararge aegeria TaxID=116150 RepID=UPI0019D2DA34|nr:uncharacterized protein LOC120632992 [Pararge aegeria]
MKNSHGNSYEYTPQEYVNMLLCYGKARCVTTEALRISKKKYPDSPCPGFRTFHLTFQRIADNEPIVPSRALGLDAKGRKVKRTYEKVILSVYKNEPGLNLNAMRTLLRKQNIKVTISNIKSILKLNGLSYTPQIRPKKNRRLFYCEWLLRRLKRDKMFMQNVLWTDDSVFTKWNMKNRHIPGQAATTPDGWSLNVWAGMLNDELFGPVFLPQPTSYETYLEFVKGPLMEILYELPLAQRSTMWFQHDNFKPHNGMKITVKLNSLFERRWIGVERFNPFPFNAADLSPIHFIWDYIKMKVFSKEHNTAGQMQEAIVSAFNDLRSECKENPILHSSQFANVIKTVQACVKSERGK